MVKTSKFHLGTIMSTKGNCKSNRFINKIKKATQDQLPEKDNSFNDFADRLKKGIFISSEENVVYGQYFEDYLTNERNKIKKG